ncbi:MAG: ThuA domain-containing protein [Fimbriimonadaceae bacterium]
MILAALALATQQVSIPELGALVFSKTAGFRHASIENGKQMFKKLAEENAWILDVTEDADEFIRVLPTKRVVVFLSTTGDVLNGEQQMAFEAWYRKGGGFVGIHAAADTEYDWPWYGCLVGAWFKSHPAIQPATVVVEDNRHPVTRGMGATLVRTDEWYDYRINPRGAVYVLASLDTSSYAGHTMGKDHPITWCHEFDGGRAFYTGFGHTAESYTEPLFVGMVTRAVKWAGKKL